MIDGGRLEIFERLKILKDSFEQLIKGEPAFVLSEADLNSILYAHLRSSFKDAIPVGEYNLSPVYSQYRIAFGKKSMRPDLVILDERKVRATSLQSTSMRNSHNFLWALPVAAIIELKYAGYGDSQRNLGDEVRRDISKIDTFRGMSGLEDAIVWLSGYDQRAKCFCHSHLYYLDDPSGEKPPSGSKCDHGSEKLRISIK